MLSWGAGEFLFISELSAMAIEYVTWNYPDVNCIKYEWSYIIWTHLLQAVQAALSSEGIFLKDNHAWKLTWAGYFRRLYVEGRQSSCGCLEYQFLGSDWTLLHLIFQWLLWHLFLLVQLLVNTRFYLSLVPVRVLARAVEWAVAVHAMPLCRHVSDFALWHCWSLCF